MSRLTIIPIVEGQGEVIAVPILIRRWLEFRRFNRYVQVAGPVRASGSGALKVAHDASSGLGIEHYIRIAQLKGSDAILAILDADDECPATLGSSLLARARAILPVNYPIGVVVANREYEARFLAAMWSSRFRDGLAARKYSIPHQSAWIAIVPEQPASAKQRMKKLLSLEKYKETIHQAEFTEVLPISQGVAKRSRSFRKLLKELESLLNQARRHMRNH